MKYVEYLALVDAQLQPGFCVLLDMGTVLLPPANKTQGGPPASTTRHTTLLVIQAIMQTPALMRLMSLQAIALLSAGHAALTSLQTAGTTGKVSRRYQHNDFCVTKSVGNAQNRASLAACAEEAEMATLRAAPTGCFFCKCVISWQGADP